MSFEQEVREAYDVVERVYLDLVVNSYRHLFERIKVRTLDHMKSEGISEINLGVHAGLIFKQDGQFYNGNGQPVELRELPGIYQKESDYIAGCADDRHHVTPSVHDAMNSALSDFRDKFKKSLTNLADVL